MSYNRTVTEKDLFDVYSENNGYTIATNGLFVAIGNPNTYNFFKDEGIARLGEVRVYKKNVNKNNDYDLFFICTSSLPLPNTRNLYVCDSQSDTSNSIIYQSKYGQSIAISKDYLIVGDYDCIIEREPCKESSFFSMGKVDVYDLTPPPSIDNLYKSPVYTIDPNVNINIDNINTEQDDTSIVTRFGYPYNYPYPLIDSGSEVCTIIDDHTKEDFLNGFGKSISISDKYISVGCPYSIDTEVINNKNNSGSISGDSSSFNDSIDYYTYNINCSESISIASYAAKKINRPGVVLVYEYNTDESTNTFKLIDEEHPFIIHAPVVTENGTNVYPINFGRNVKIDDNSNCLLISYYAMSGFNSCSIIPRVNAYYPATERIQFCCNDTDSGSNNTQTVWKLMYGGVLEPIQTGQTYIDFFDYSIDLTESILPDLSSGFNLDFGCSTDVVSGKYIIVGSPTELKYSKTPVLTTESMSPSSLSGSSDIEPVIHSRGACYLYTIHNNQQIRFHSKIYGGENVFYDNLFGISVAANDDYFAVGSPKNNIPFSTNYLSQSINTIELSTKENIYNEDSFNGQVVLFKFVDDECVTRKTVEYATSYPISLRKVYENSYNAFGFSVDMSTENLVVGAPCILHSDLNLIYPYAQESTGSTSASGKFTYNDYISASALLNPIHDASDSYFNTSSIDAEFEKTVAYGTDEYIIRGIFGTGHIYNFIDLIENYHVGNVFYNNNRLVINNDGEICKYLFKNPKQPTEKVSLQGMINSLLTSHELQYICTIEPGEFNVSTNPTSINMESISFPYEITNKFKFTFRDLDYIMRYISSLVNDNNEKWWTYIAELDEENLKAINDSYVEKSIFDYYCETLSSKKLLKNDINNHILTNDLKEKIGKFDLDINGDHVVDINDFHLLWKCFIGTLNNVNYKKYITADSTRIYFDDIIGFVDGNIGKAIKPKPLSHFTEYEKNTSNDPLGSYLAPYITQVGLYSGTELVMVGKLGNPIKNTGEIPINFVVKWDI